MKGKMMKASMPVCSHAAKEQVVSAAKERKHGGKVVGMDMGKKAAERCDRAPRKRGGAVLSASASKAPMAEAATSVTNRPGMK